MVGGYYGESGSAGFIGAALLGLFPLLANRIVERIKAPQVYAGWTRSHRFA